MNLLHELGLYYLLGCGLLVNGVIFVLVIGWAASKRIAAAQLKREVMGG